MWPFDWFRSGNDAARKRGAAAADDSRNAKRQKTTESSIVEELICPITLALPYDPVTAEDGRVYEREAIEQHIDSHDEDDLKSPVTNELMGPRLVASHQIKNIIEKMISNGHITGELAETWLRGPPVDELLESWKKEAANGDARSALTAALYIWENNRMGPEVIKWLSLAVNHGNTVALALQCMFAPTQGIETSDLVHVAATISKAATKGSPFACLSIAAQYAKGAVLPMDHMKVEEWLERCNEGHASIEEAVTDEIFNECKEQYQKDGARKMAKRVFDYVKLQLITIDESFEDWF